MYSTPQPLAQLALQVPLNIVQLDHGPASCYPVLCHDVGALGWRDQAGWGISWTRPVRP